MIVRIPNHISFKSFKTSFPVNIVRNRPVPREGCKIFKMNVDKLFSAGTDSTRITLSSMVGLVMERPEIQRKMHAELDDVLGMT